MTSDAACPDDQVTVEAGAIGEVDVVGGHLLHGSVHPDVDAQARKLPARVALQPAIERPEQPVGHLDQDDVEVVHADLGIQHRQRLGLHLGQRARGLTPVAPPPTTAVNRLFGSASAAINSRPEDDVATSSAWARV